MYFVVERCSLVNRSDTKTSNCVWWWWLNTAFKIYTGWFCRPKLLSIINLGPLRTESLCITQWSVQSKLSNEWVELYLCFCCVSAWHNQRQLFLSNSITTAETSSCFTNVNVFLIFVAYFVTPSPRAVIVEVGTVDCPRFESRHGEMDFSHLQNVQSGFGAHSTSY